MHTDPVTGQMVADPGDSLAPGIAPGQAASTETQGTSVSRGGLAPEAQARLDAGRTVEQQSALGLTDVAKQAGAVAEQQARVREEQANREAAVSAEYNTRRLQALDAADRDIAAARAAHKQAFDDYRNMGIHDYWEDKSAGKKINASIAVALGGLNQRYNGGSNIALDQLNKVIDRDLAVQRENIMKARDVANEAKGNVADVAQMKAGELKNLDIKEAAARLKIADEMKARLSSLGIPQAQIDTNRAVLEQQQKAAEKLQKVDESERTHIVSTHTKALQQPGAGMVFGEGGKPLVDVGDKAKSEKINTAIATARDMSKSIRELQALDAKGVSVPIVGETAQRREALRSSILVAAKTQYQLGALSEGDMKIIESQLGGRLSDTTGVGRGARLDEVAKLLQQKTITFLDSQGLAGSDVATRVGITADAPAAPKTPAATPAAPATRPAPARGLSTQDRAKLMLHLRQNPNDPRADDIRAALGQ